MSSYSYSRENEEAPPKNVRFQHFYEVQRFGVSPIEEVDLILRIPTRWQHGAGDIVIANVNSVVGVMDGSQFYCDNFNRTDVPLFDDSSKLVSAAFIVAESPPRVKDNRTRANFSSGEGAPMDVPSANRTLYVNCTSNAVRCKQVNCKVGPFLSTMSVAKLLITLDLQVPNFHGK